MSDTIKKPNTILGAPEILKLFRDQHGLASRRQLLARGVHRDALTRAVASGQIVPVFRGIYRTALAPETDRQRVLAGCLAVDGAVASHRTAAWLHRFEGFERLVLEVSVTTGARAKGVTSHRVRELGPDEVMVIDGIPVTREARTLVDLGAVVSERSVARAFDDANRRGLVRLPLIERLLTSRSPGRRAKRVMRALLRERAPEDARAVKELEALFLREARRRGIPRGLVNVDIRERGRYIARPDVQWPRAAVALFLDGYAYHSSRPEFEKDRRQSNALAARGWTVLRYTWARLRKAPDEVFAELRTILDGSREAAPGAASGVLS